MAIAAAETVKTRSGLYQTKSCNPVILGDVVSIARPYQKFAKTYEVAVVGGGPAGAYLGYCLAQNGIGAILINQESLSENSAVVHVSSRALRKFPILKAIPGPKEIVHQIQLITANGISATVAGKTGQFALSVRRGTLIGFLRDAAIKKGSTYLNAKVRTITPERGGWVLRAGKEIIRARVLIGADGVKSCVRETVLEPFSNRDLNVSIRYQSRSPFKGPLILKFLGQGRAGHIQVSGGQDGANFRIVDRVTCCAGLKKDLDTFVASHFNEPGIHSQQARLEPGPCSPEFYGLPCAGKNWVLIGEAAGHTDQLTGNGIIYALWSAQLASEALADGDPRLFDSLWHEQYKHEIVAISDSPWLRYPNSIDAAVKIARRSETFSDILFNRIAAGKTLNVLSGKFLRSIPGIAHEVLMTGTRS